MKGFGHGRQTDITAEDAIEIARGAQPRALPADTVGDALLGKSVRIAPNDYAQNPVAGVLAASTPTRWIIKREQDSCGTVHVHFPKQGFAIAQS